MLPSFHVEIAFLFSRPLMIHLFFHFFPVLHTLQGSEDSPVVSIKEKGLMKGVKSLLPQSSPESFIALFYKPVEHGYIVVHTSPEK
ncbi:hypothetical protein [Spirochaeta thermophila]|uniref:hypothetical protein n=1 Tax=Winmispira thermophila TaxID=154 RepID=UPI0015753E46|nr:hypothetical protein [Spirochaeta thermophila]